MRPYFDQIVVSDEFGYRKPNVKIFNHAMEKAGASSDNSLMIGDDYVADVVGAQSVGMDQVFFAVRPEEDEHKATYTINSLLELKEIL